MNEIQAEKVGKTTNELGNALTASLLKNAGLKKTEKPSHYLPITFEGMMESFGINLQRKYYYDEFYKAHSQIENMTKTKNFTHTDIVNLAQKTGEQMRQIVSISSADSSSLKN